MEVESTGSGCTSKKDARYSYKQEVNGGGSANAVGVGLGFGSGCGQGHSHLSGGNGEPHGVVYQNWPIPGSPTTRIIQAELEYNSITNFNKVL